MEDIPEPPPRGSAPVLGQDSRKTGKTCRLTPFLPVCQHGGRISGTQNQLSFARAASISRRRVNKQFLHAEGKIGKWLY